MRYYLDTSIWLDYYEKRGQNGENALCLLLKIIKSKEVVLVSDLHITELKGLGYTIDEIHNIFRIVKPNNVRRVHIGKEQINEARHLALSKEIPKRDALHAILARDNEALMVATDKHFEKLLDVVETKRPEELY